ncbi:MAG: TetR/AcrR family transcriptional regulator [Burkholderiaceae bacterium]
MVQTKKAEVRDAILKSARQLFNTRGYHGASMAQIAADAGVSAANIYVYFGSKLEVLFAIYDPWLRARLLRLEDELQRVEPGQTQLRFILKTLWVDIPSEENGFANNLMQALSSVTPADPYSRELLSWTKRKITALIAGALPSNRRFLVRDDGLAHILLMAFDGFALNQHLDGDAAKAEQTLDTMLMMLGGFQDDGGVSQL